MNKKCAIIALLLAVGPGNVVLAQEDKTSAPEAAAVTRAADIGLLTGRVISQGSEAPIAGVLVTATGDGEPLYSRTDALGRFEIGLPAGTYTLSLDHRQYGERVLEGIEVAAGVEQEINLTLGRARVSAPDVGSDMEELVVKGTYVPRGDDREQWSHSILDIISAEDFSVTGDSSAVDALARVTGLTVVNDKYVYVRGLGERYSNTTFNGAHLPSPDPTRRVIPMDLFPTGVLESVDIQKTYSPDLPGDFSGGTVQMRTRQVPDQRVSKLSLELGANEETTGEPGLIYKAGDQDYELFGIDDGFRDLPGTLDEITQGGTRSLNDVSDQELLIASRSLNNEYDTQLEDIPANFSAELNLGNRFETDGGSIGYLIGGRWSNSWTQRKEERATFGLDGQGGLSPLDSGTQFRTENTVDLSFIGNVEWEVNDANVLRNTTFVTHRTDDRFIREFDFLSENDIDVADSTVEFVERQLFTQQFSGEHVFANAGDLELLWQTSYSRADREEPDTRFWRYEQANDGTYFFSDTGQSNERTWEDLQDEVISFGADVIRVVDFSESVVTTFKGGISYYDKERDSEFRRFRYLSDFSQNNLRSTLGAPSPELIFADENLGPGLWELNEFTQPTDNYDATEEIMAYYVMADTELGDKWRVVAGARFEDSQQEVRTFELANPDQATTGMLDESEVLPAITGTWLLNDEMQLRFGMSQTLNRPDLKELSEAPYIDPEERYTVIGNPNLQIATIDNFDVRWEWYFGDGDSLQVAGFYKDFDMPLERVIRLGAGGIRTFANAESAENSGVEVTFNKLLPNDLYLNFNGALIDSEVDIGNAGAQQTNQNRELQGQSPWVVNLQFGYDNPDRDVQAVLLFNMAGERITDVGTQGLPDAFEQPAPRLDLNYRHVLPIGNQNIRLKFRAANLLDPDYEVERGSAIERMYTKGRTYELGFDWEFR